MSQLKASSVDDLDDLDRTYMIALTWTDVLDDFDAKPPTDAGKSTTAAASTDAAAEADAAEAEGAEDPLSDEFVEELTKNMESFMEQLGKHMHDGKDAKMPPPPPASQGAVGEERGGVPPAEDELMKQFERLLSGSMEGLDTKNATPSQTGAAGGANVGASEGPSEKSFQDAVKATMEKLKQSNASANTSSGKDASDPLAALGLDGNADLAKMLEALSQGGEDGDMSLGKMLAQMMDELMNKDVLYEPLKDMHTRFPKYFESDAAQKLDAETRGKYVKQQEIMGEILSIFESPDYSDSNNEIRSRVTDLVSTLQDQGTPPQELLGDMPPELTGLNNMLGGESSDENCVIM